jgi:hypothetical protein
MMSMMMYVDMRGNWRHNLSEYSRSKAGPFSSGARLTWIVPFVRTRVVLGVIW